MPSITVPQAILGAAALGTGASLYAGSQQAGAAKDANALQGQIYQQNRADLTPWRQTGSNALSLLAQSLGVTPYSAGGTAGGAATDPSQTPGMLAAQQAGAGHSGGGGFSGLGALGGAAAGAAMGSVVPGIGTLVGGLAGGLMPNLFKQNRPYIQDIAAALQQGKTITDAQWAQAGYGPGGTGGPGQGGTAQQAQVTQAPSTGPYGAFQSSPGYGFAFDEGLRATDAGASARGMTRSGGTLRAEQRFGTGLANQEFGNWQNRLAALAGIGQTATGQGVQAGQNYANQSSNLLQDAAASRASGYVGAGNAIGGGLGQYAQYLGTQNAAQNNYTTAGGGMYKGSYLAPFDSEAAALGF